MKNNEKSWWEWYRESEMMRLAYQGAAAYMLGLIIGLVATIMALAGVRGGVVLWPYGISWILLTTGGLSIMKACIEALEG